MSLLSFMKTSKRQTESNPPPNLATTLTAFRGGVETISEIAQRLKRNPIDLITTQAKRPVRGSVPIRVFACGFYCGVIRTENPNVRTRLLYASKFYNNKEARAAIVEEMTEIADCLCFDILTYAPAHDSKINHAKLLAVGIAQNVGRAVISPTRLAKSNLSNYRILVIDDVFNTGATLRKLWLKLLPCAPDHLDALVFLKSRRWRQNFF